MNEENPYDPGIVRDRSSPAQKQNDASILGLLISFVAVSSFLALLGFCFANVYFTLNPGHLQSGTRTHYESFESSDTSSLVMWCIATTASGISLAYSTGKLKSNLLGMFDASKAQRRKPNEND